MNDRNNSEIEQEWQEMVAEWLRQISRGQPDIDICGRNDAARFFPDSLMDGLVLIAKALVGNTTLVQLSLIYIHLDERATVALASAIRQSNIKKLYLCDMTFVADTPGDRQRIAMILRDGIQSSTTILQLNVWNMNEYTSTFSEDLIKTPTSLKSLKMVGSLGGNQLLPVTRDNLIRSLQTNTSLTEIGFDNIAMDNQDVNLIVDSLHPNLPLVHLDLVCNKIGPMGVQALLRAMTNHPTWKELNLHGNKTIGFEGLRVMGEELQNTHQFGQPGINVTTPKFISIYVPECVVWNDFNEDEKETEAALQQNMARTRAEQAILAGMKDNVLIVTLATDFDFLTEAVFKKIKFYLKLNQNGRYLLGTNHGLPCAIWCQIFAKCTRYNYGCFDWDNWLTRSVIFYFLREQPHLVVPS